MAEGLFTTETPRHRERQKPEGPPLFYFLISGFSVAFSASLCLCGELAGFFTPSYGLPIAYKKCSVRKKMRPSEIAGELNV